MRKVRKLPRGLIDLRELTVLVFSLSFFLDVIKSLFQSLIMRHLFAFLPPLSIVAESIKEMLKK